MIKKKKIYLAGSVYEDDYSKNWKKTFIECMGYPERYYFYDPNPVKELQAVSGNLINYDVVGMDKRQIKDSNILVAYVNKASFGTSMEIHYAYSLENISIYVINPNLLFKRDIWLTYHASMFFSTIEDCADQINGMYNNVIITNEEICEINTINHITSSGVN